MPRPGDGDRERTEPSPATDVTTTWVEQVYLLPNSQTLAAARGFVDQVLAGHHVDDPLESIHVVVSALVTNAVKHAGAFGLIHLTLAGLHHGAVRVTVTDRGPSSPALHLLAALTRRKPRNRPLRHHPDDHVGLADQGLELVQELAHQWGIEAVTTDTYAAGQRVWAGIDTTLPDGQ